ncbi:peptidase M28 family protein [Putridiphycobacter roseus]|uniref:Carboxypeptidase Q n=1 Tax=Putridiphycobacter roseus TaxID=2219161 RepID=A0A2W1NKN8_9FLAO|nr:M20/M25/M40 family metallo-hydrolase [Putridiphycobacter roseus]PZE18426.1 peptidase M28 family protein [Putridiphycobacter roseus]
MKNFFLPFIILFSFTVLAQKEEVFIRKIYDEALENGEAYENLRSLCKDIGARVTGSAEAEMAVEWGQRLLKAANFDKVYLQEIMVPHWERGTKEVGWITTENGKLLKLDILALGMSIGTNGLLSAEVIEVEDLDALRNKSAAAIQGKIVFINKPFDQKLIKTFQAYGACWPIRGNGAVEAAKKGALGVVIRSLATPTDHFAHTGSMHYEANVNKIPAAAISTKHANVLSDWLKEGKVILKMEMDCAQFADKVSYNVIGEMTGKEDAQIITIGGHLDSWDVGEGAHDDGAGVVHSVEALRILKELGYKNKHTLRVVLFMNEENGNFGGKTYAKIAAEKKEVHIAAIESDRGGFLPVGFDVVGDSTQLKFVQNMYKILNPFQIYRLEAGYGGVDINPLREYYPAMLQLGLAISSQRYFDYHHAHSDVFENVNKRELELGAAAMSAMLYLLDQKL